MPDFRIILVSPKNDGNVGAVVRSMGNFGFKELCLVSPCEITDEAYRRAKHAGDILRQARTVESLDQAIEGCDLVVGTSGIVTAGEKHYVRIPIAPREFAERMKEYEERVAVLFGPEDTGLFQEDLMRCDMLVSIPSSEEYPVLNLSHAATIVMYELFQTRPRKAGGPRPTNEQERERLLLFFDDLLDSVDYPEFRRERTRVMFRRLMGRAVPTKWEFHTIMGVLGDAAKKIKRLESKKD
ncbi:MAG: TrmJ/YjtD family RNA methyltransferase [Methanomassiliicoccales archaeon]|jgi:TrmH family RNA methyltransferase|nr:TrmJ/YjtD family RNA methyltransferase [Methanomassiliicoccales archaeon]